MSHILIDLFCVLLYDYIVTLNPYEAGNACYNFHKVIYALLVSLYYLQESFRIARKSSVLHA